MAAVVRTIITGTIIDMVMSSEVRTVRIASAFFIARALICLFGLSCVFWGASMLPAFRQETTLNRIASDLLRGGAFKLPVLSEEAEQIGTVRGSTFCDPAALHSVVVIRVAILQKAIAGADRASVDAASVSLYNSAKTALACSPADPFTWLTLFWLDAAKSGLTPENTNYLRLSYALGPNEGWIGLWRIQLALPMLDRLPSDLSSDAINEFVKLVDTQVLYREMSAIFVSLGPAVRSRIVEQLKTAADPLPRQVFARTLYDHGVDINIPGVDPPTRPWR
jgi:hypothetical protein